jgi:hypothetical protein
MQAPIETRTGIEQMTDDDLAAEFSWAEAMERLADTLVPSSPQSCRS